MLSDDERLLFLESLARSNGRPLNEEDAEPQLEKACKWVADLRLNSLLLEMVLERELDLVVSEDGQVAFTRGPLLGRRLAN